MLGTDSVCTVIYVALQAGTADQDITDALAWQHDQIRHEDFAPCASFEHYWSGVWTIPA